MTDNVAFGDIHPGDFPFKIEWFREGTDELVHAVTVDGPGAVQVPGLRAEGEAPVYVVMTFPDGTVMRK